MKAELRYYFGVKNWNKLSENTVLRMYKELEYIRTREADQTAAKLNLQ